MPKGRTALLNKLLIAGITISLLGLAFTPFFISEEVVASGYEKVIVVHNISKDFYSSMGRSFVDAEQLEHFVGIPEEEEEKLTAISKYSSDTALDSFLPAGKK